MMRSLPLFLLLSSLFTLASCKDVNLGVDGVDAGGRGGAGMASGGGGGSAPAASGGVVGSTGGTSVPDASVATGGVGTDGNAPAASGGVVGSGGQMATGGTSVPDASVATGGVGTGGSAPTASGGALGSGGTIATGGTGVPDASVATGGVGTGGSAGGSGTGGTLGLDAGPACTGPAFAAGSYTFTATPVVIAPGQSSTLAWDHPNATTLSLDQGIGSVLGKTSQVVAPAQTTTYTLTMNGSLSESVTVVVTESKFTRVGSMTVARSGHTATLLANGKVLIAGGSGSNNALASAELYDPATKAFTTTGNLTVPRDNHTATLLESGKVLIAGGSSSNNARASAELYDPATERFTATGNLTVPRDNHTATLVKSGKVLIAGGYSGTDALASAELYDTATGVFTATGNLTVARREHAATRLQSGTVLLAGGFVPPTDTGNNDGLTSAELYDPATATFTATGSMKMRRSAPTTTLLNDGTVLVGGGPHGFEGYFDSDYLEQYNPATGLFADTGRMIVKRAFSTSTLLSSGLVLIAGGYQHTPSSYPYLDSAELYDRTACTCVPTASLTEKRAYHTATLLQDGTVLVAGGYVGNSTLASAEIYK